MSKLRSSLLQRQLRMQAQMLANMHIHVQSCKDCIGWFKDQELEGSVQSWRKNLKDIRKQIAKLDELQRFTKRELQEAYTIEQFEKTWEAIPDIGLEESFLAGRVRMAAEDGFVEPGVVLSVVEVK